MAYIGIFLLAAAVLAAFLALSGRHTVSAEIAKYTSIAFFVVSLLLLFSSWVSRGPKGRAGRSS